MQDRLFNQSLLLIVQNRLQFIAITEKISQLKKIIHLFLKLNIRGMESEQSCIESQIKGFRLRIRLEGQTLKVTINCRQSGKKYQSDLTYQTQSDNFKFAFANLQQLFQHIKDELTAKSEMIKISAQGNLQIGSKIKQKTRFLLLKIQQVQIQQSERLIQVLSFLEKDTNELKVNVEEIKKNLDEQQQESMLKIKQWLRRQINELKQQLFDAVNLKSDIKETDQKVATLKQQLIGVVAQIEKNNQINISMDQAIKQIEKKLSRDCKENEDKLKQANTKIQELKRQVKQLEKNSELQLLRLIILEKSLKKNSEEQLRRLAQTTEVQTALISRVQQQAKKFKLAEILLNYKFPNMMDYEFFPLTVDSNIGQFKAGYFRMKNNNGILQRVMDNDQRQVVSKEQLPRKGKYYFQVMFHYSSDSQPNYINALVGIITQDQRKNKKSYHSKQSISFYLGNGSIYENGSSRVVGTSMYAKKGLVTVVLDADQKKISWYYDHQFQYSTIISNTIMDKKIYACIQVYYQGTIIQFKS